MNASAEFFKNIGKSGWYTNSKKWMEKFGINGFAGVLTYLFGFSQKDLESV